MRLDALDPLLGPFVAGHMLGDVPPVCGHTDVLNDALRTRGNKFNEQALVSLLTTQWLTWRDVDQWPL